MFNEIFAHSLKFFVFNTLKVHFFNASNDKNDLFESLCL